MSEDLIAFVRRALDADERGVSGRHTFGCSIRDPAYADTPADVDLTDPDLCSCPVRERLLDVRAKRRLLAWLDVVDRFLDQEPMDYYRLGGQADTDVPRQLLASIYSDRPGFRQEWAPDATS